MPTDQARPKILLLTRNLPPLVGGMERLMQNLAGGMVEYAEVTVIGPRGCAQHLPKEADVLEVSAKLVPFLILSLLLSIRTCRSQSFDLVVGGSGLTAPTLFFLSLIFGPKTVVFLHGLDLVVDSLPYKLLFLPCIRRVDRIIANSDNTRALALERGVRESRIAIVNPGTELPELPDDLALTDFREKFSIAFGKVIIFVGRLTRRKGLSGFIRHSLPAILSAEPTAGLVIVGENPRDSLNKLGEEQAVLAEIAGSQMSERIVFLGHVNDKDLIACYASATVQILPLIEVSGDVEGFGMIAVEAAACGTPTVAFNLGGVSDAISADNGYLIPARDYGALSSAVLETLNKGQPDRASCIGHASRYSWPIFNDKVRTELDKLL